MTNPPSQHYAATIGGLVDGVSVAFRTLVGQFVDGERAAPSGKLEIYAASSNTKRAKVVVLDRSKHATKCFVVDIDARELGDGLGEWDKTRANPPELLDGVLNGGVWQLYNCSIALQEWGREEALNGVFR